MSPLITSIHAIFCVLVKVLRRPVEITGGKRTFQVGQFCENLGDIPECPLFSKADLQMPQNPQNRRSTFGQ
jgi:hypothetical protein